MLGVLIVFFFFFFFYRPVLYADLFWSPPPDTI